MLIIMIIILKAVEMVSVVGGAMKIRLYEVRRLERGNIINQQLAKFDGSTTPRSILNTYM